MLNKGYAVALLVCGSVACKRRPHAEQHRKPYGAEREVQWPVKEGLMLNIVSSTRRIPMGSVACKRRPHAEHKFIPLTTLTPVQWPVKEGLMLNK